MLRKNYGSFREIGRKREKKAREILRAEYREPIEKEKGAHFF